MHPVPPGPEVITNAAACPATTFVITRLKSRYEKGRTSLTDCAALLLLALTMTRHGPTASVSSCIPYHGFEPCPVSPRAWTHSRANSAGLVQKPMWPQASTITHRPTLLSRSQPTSFAVTPTDSPPATSHIPPKK